MKENEKSLREMGDTKNIKIYVKWEYQNRRENTVKNFLFNILCQNSPNLHKNVSLK